LVSRKVQVDVAEIVLPRALDDQPVRHPGEPTGR